MTDNEFMTWLDSKHVKVKSWQRTSSGIEMLHKGKLILITDAMLAGIDSWDARSKKRLLEAILHKEANHGKRN